MTRHSARGAGTFEVTHHPHAPYDADGAPLARMPLTKLFVGGLDATSAVEMIGARTAAKGSAGYVAIEHVRGALDGREGSFVLQHSGTQRGSVTVTTNGRISRRFRNSEHHFASSGVSSTVGD